MGKKKVVDSSMGNVGVAMLERAVRITEWIPRRSEQIEIVDSATGRRSVRVDIDLAGFDSDEPVLWRSKCVLPIARLDRQNPFAEIVITDESDALIPRLNRTEERKMAYDGFKLLATAVSPAAEQADWQRVRQIIFDGDSVAYDELHSLYQQLISDDRTREVDAEHVLAHACMSDPAVRNALTRLRDEYYLVALVDPDVKRRVLRYTYLGPIQEATKDGGPVGTALTRFTDLARSQWSNPGTQGLRIPIAGVDQCVSYHATIPAPHDLNVDTTTLQLTYTNGTKKTIPDVHRVGVEGHVFAHEEHDAPSSLLLTRLYLQPGGVARSALAASLFAATVFTFALLWVIFDQDHGLARVDADAGSTLIILAPGIVSTVVSRPDRLHLTTRLLTGTRVVLGILTAASFAGAVSVAMKFSGSLMIPFWVIVALTAWIGTIVLGRQYAKVNQLVRGGDSAAAAEHTAEADAGTRRSS